MDVKDAPTYISRYEYMCGRGQSGELIATVCDVSVRKMLNGKYWDGFQTNSTIFVIKFSDSPRILCMSLADASIALLDIVGIRPPMMDVPRLLKEYLTGRQFLVEFGNKNRWYWHLQ